MELNKIVSQLQKQNNDLQKEMKEIKHDKSN